VAQRLLLGHLRVGGCRAIPGRLELSLGWEVDLDGVEHGSILRVGGCLKEALGAVADAQVPLRLRPPPAGHERSGIDACCLVS
jgi:hypothetical protein